MDREEVFVVTAGQVSADVAGEEVLAGPGDAIIVPAHAALRIRSACPQNPATITAGDLGRHEGDGRRRDLPAALGPVTTCPRTGPGSGSRWRHRAAPRGRTMTVMNGASSKGCV
ncbi:cupin domain-containing protein [Streptoverticillium reticulum]|uniref:cupin domain-containing protein n=1 Tax=Streptoverticillium reticulum TaxID=1433415 RepID=UPI0039BF3D44